MEGVGFGRRGALGPGGQNGECHVIASLGHFVVHQQGKLQKHQAFEAEVQANSGAIVKLDETGNLMISEGHFASETIRVSKWGLMWMWIHVTCQVVFLKRESFLALFFNS